MSYSAALKICTFTSSRSFKPGFPVLTCELLWYLVKQSHAFISVMFHSTKPAFQHLTCWCCVFSTVCKMLWVPFRWNIVWIQDGQADHCNTSESWHSPWHLTNGKSSFFPQYSASPAIFLSTGDKMLGYRTLKIPCWISQNLQVPPRGECHFVAVSAHSLKEFKFFTPIERISVSFEWQSEWRHLRVLGRRHSNWSLGCSIL